MSQMHRLTVELASRPYDIAIAPGLLGRLHEYIGPLTPTSIHIVTDTVVGPLYLDAVRNSCNKVAATTYCTIGGGESAKDLQTVAQVIDALIKARADRGSVVVALGGGVVGDVAGFAAAVFMRGVRVVQVPTTLLAQVDSSVGGKTGVNHPSGKNLIGAFHQPSVVVSDPSVLRSLPPRELSAGLAEVLKHGLLADHDYFERTVRDLPALLALDEEVLANAIARSCQIKACIVGRDERESGERALLNLGHTFGHAIEALTGFGLWLHGEAVGCGLCLAGDLSSRLGLIGSDDVKRIEEAVQLARLPARIEGLSMTAALEAMRGDKKTHAGRIRFIVLERIGRAIQTEAPEALVQATLGAAGYC
jgi:3-dehydroquinate synthase